jgi:hypothetical protein
LKYGRKKVFKGHVLGKTKKYGEPVGNKGWSYDVKGGNNNKI